MTLARTALRLATIAALKGDDAATGPTIANNRVYDSRISDFSPETYPADALPSVVVLTDEDEGDALSSQNGGPPFERMVKLVIEFAMVQGFDVALEDGGTEFVPGYPATDTEHEASLDLLEFQIKRRLADDPAAFSTLWRSFTRVWKFDCHRQVMDDQGIKIAARILTWVCQVPDDQVIIHKNTETLPVGWNVLPEPLRRVAIALPENSAGQDVCIAIAKALVPLSLPQLDAFMMTASPQDLTNMNFSAEILSGLDVPQFNASDIAGQIDFQKGITATVDQSYQKLTLDQNVAALSVVGWPRFGINAKLVLEITNVGSFAISGWPAGTRWVGGSMPIITVGAGKRDIVILTTPDGGTTIFGNVVGQDYH